MPRRTAVPKEPEPEQEERHGLDPGEQIIGEAVRDGQHVVVTSEGRKVILDADGRIIERQVGPLYEWEME